MATRAAPIGRSENMARIKRRDTSLELLVRTAVRTLGHAYRIDIASLPGRPDLSNQKRRWAIFVNGCFWHQHETCGAGRVPKSNVGYWAEKLARNKRRDEANVRELRSMGYAVLVVWECELAPEKLDRILRNFFKRVERRIER